MTVRFFDGHNDMLLRLWHNDDWGATAFLESDGSGHIDRERMAAAHMIGSFFAIFIPTSKTDMLAAGPVDQKRALIQCLLHRTRRWRKGGKNQRRAAYRGGGDDFRQP